MRRQAHICQHGLLCLGFGICLFPTLLSFMLVISFAPEVLQEDEWYRWIFLLAVYRLDVFKQIVYTYGLSLSPRVGSVAKQAASESGVVFWLICWVSFFFSFFFSHDMKCQTSVLLLCLLLYSLFSPNSCFVLYNLTTNPPQVLLAKESWSFVVIFGECKGHKQITKLEKCCTHGMPFVLFWRHVILKSGIVQEFMHADTDGSWIRTLNVCVHVFARIHTECLCEGKMAEAEVREQFEKGQSL